jgi:hypothetical protein
MIRSDGSALAAYQGRMAPPPPEAKDLVEIFYLSMFPIEFTAQRASAIASAHQSRQWQAAPAQNQAAANQGQPIASDRPTKAQCRSAYMARTYAILGKMLFPGIIARSCAASVSACMGLVVTGIGLVPGIAAGATILVTCGALVAATYILVNEILESDAELEECLAKAID